MKGFATKYQCSQSQCVRTKNFSIARSVRRHCMLFARNFYSMCSALLLLLSFRKTKSSSRHSAMNVSQSNLCSCQPKDKYERAQSGCNVLCQLDWMKLAARTNGCFVCIRYSIAYIRIEFDKTILMDLSRVLTTFVGTNVVELTFSSPSPFSLMWKLLFSILFCFVFFFFSKWNLHDFPLLLLLLAIKKPRQNKMETCINIFFIRNTAHAFDLARNQSILIARYSEKWLTIWWPAIKFHSTIVDNNNSNNNNDGNFFSSVSSIARNASSSMQNHCTSYVFQSATDTGTQSEIAQYYGLRKQRQTIKW